MTNKPLETWLQWYYKVTGNVINESGSFTTGNSDVEFYITGELLEDNQFMKRRFMERR